MPKIDIDTAPSRTGSSYPGDLKRSNEDKLRVRLGDAVGLTQFGVNLSTIPPGSASALRHWHKHQDEFVWVVDGEVVLVDDSGETVLRTGDAAGFTAGDGNGHCIVNRSDRPAKILEVGTRTPTEHVQYPDNDLVLDITETGVRWTREDGTPYD